LPGQAPESSQLPPHLTLYSVGQPIRPVRVWRTAYKTAESVGPVPVGKECAQDWSAEKLAAHSDLWRYGNLAQSTVVLTGYRCSVQARE